MNPHRPLNQSDLDVLDEPIGRPFGQPRFRPDGSSRQGVSPLRASIGRMVRSPEAIAIIACLSIWGGTFYAIWRLA